MRQSLEKAGIDPATENKAGIDFSGNISTANKAWKDVWSAGHGVGNIRKYENAGEIVASLVDEYQQAVAATRDFLQTL